MESESADVAEGGVEQCVGERVGCADRDLAPRVPSTDLAVGDLRRPLLSRGGFPYVGVEIPRRGDGGTVEQRSQLDHAVGI